MKKILLLLIVLFLQSELVYTQTNDACLLQMSYNKITLGFQHQFNKVPLRSKICFGVSNQDVNVDFDDFVVEFHIGKTLLALTNSACYTSLMTGVYFPENKYFKISTPFVGLKIGYEYYLGKMKIHALFAEFGYLYGKRDYHQVYKDEKLTVKTVDTFSLAPFSFTIGYGVHF